MSGRFVASNIVSGFQGYCFTNEVGVFLSSKQMSLKWENQTINDTQSCVSTCLLVKGVQTKEMPTLKRKGRKTYQRETKTFHVDEGREHEKRI